MDAWQIVKWLANADMLNSERNVFSVAIFGLMFILAFYRSYKIRRIVLKALADSVIFTWFFFWILDASNFAVWNVFHITTSGAVLGPNWLDIITLSIELLTIVPFFGYYIYRSRQMVDFKALILTLPIDLFIIVLSITFFGTYNMRMLSGDARVLFYLLSFCPMWLLFLAGFCKFTRKSPIDGIVSPEVKSNIQQLRQ